MRVVMTESVLLSHFIIIVPEGHFVLLHAPVCHARELVFIAVAFHLQQSLNTQADWFVLKAAALQSSFEQSISPESRVARPRMLIAELLVLNIVNPEICEIASNASTAITIIEATSINFTCFSIPRDNEKEFINSLIFGNIIL
jgi:hypothetical protein